MASSNPSTVQRIQSNQYCQNIQRSNHKYIPPPSLNPSKSQTFFNRYSRSRRIRNPIPNYISSCNASWDSTLLTTKVKLNDDCTADSPVQNNGIQNRIHRTVITSI